MVKSQKHLNPSSPAKNSDALDNASRASALIEHLHVVMGLPLVRTFLYTATHPGMVQEEIAEALELSQTAIGNQLAKLGSEQRQINGAVIVPLGLLVIQEEGFNKQKRPYVLTAKGRKLLEDLKA